MKTHFIYSICFYLQDLRHRHTLTMQMTRKHTKSLEPRIARGDCKTRVARSAACGVEDIATRPKVYKKQRKYTIL